MCSSLVLLSDLSYFVGLIGLAEWQERVEIGRWLSDSEHGRPDPRIASADDSPPCELACEDQAPRCYQAGTVAKNVEKLGAFALVVLGKWHFTQGDPDSYPSVPHGHENSKTQSWPKLNPYTGRVFAKMDEEDRFRRLSRDEMRTIWRDSAFVDRARDQVLWYSGSNPKYPFRNARRGLLSFPKW
jgi:hypothetical protein